MKISIAQLTTWTKDMETDAASYRNAGWKNVELSFPKAHAYLRNHTLADMRKLFDDNGLHAMSGVSRARTEPGLLTTRDEAFERFFNFQFVRDIEICSAMGCEMILQADGVEQWAYKGWMDNAVQNIRRCGDFAAEHGMDLVIEMNHTREIVELMNRVNHPNVGWCIDCYHFVRLGGTDESFFQLDFSKLRDVHFCDVPPFDVFTMKDNERVLPGDGILPLKAWAQHLKKVGYGGYLTLELVSEFIWNMKDADEAARRCMKSMLPYMDM
jgi:sugar phosphate isomerase/epimerase